MTKQVLHDMEGILDLRPDARLGLLVLLEQTVETARAQRLALARAHRDVPVDIEILVLVAFVHILVACTPS